MADKAINGIDRFLHFANVMNENARADIGRARGTGNTGDAAKGTGNGGVGNTSYGNVSNGAESGGSDPSYKGTGNGEINSGTGNSDTAVGLGNANMADDAAVGRGAYSEISRGFRRVLDGGEPYESRLRGGKI